MRSDHDRVLAAEAAGETTPGVRRPSRRPIRGARRTASYQLRRLHRTSRDPRHRPAVEWLWRACARRGDLYQRDYTGSYCVGCEQFYDPADLVDRRCREHDTPTETATETNWFFRLSSYTDQLIELIETHELGITPEPFRAER